MMQLEPLGGWGPTLVTIVFSALGIAVSYGVHGRAIKEHDKQFEKIDEEQKDQWGKINDTREEVGKIKGHLNLNGAFRNERT